MVKKHIRSSSDELAHVKRKIEKYTRRYDRLIAEEKIVTMMSERSSVPVSKLPSHPCRTVKSCENAISAHRHLMRCIKSWLRTIIFLVHFHRRCLEYLQLVYVVIGWVNRSQTARPHCHDWNFSFNDDDWWTH